MFKSTTTEVNNSWGSWGDGSFDKARGPEFKFPGHRSVTLALEGGDRQIPRVPLVASLAQSMH